MTESNIQLNNVKSRFLPIPESASKGLEPEPKISDFELIKELGSGSFGRVFLVTHKKTKVQYAIKAIDKRNKTNQEEKPYFRRELEVMYKIHHPNVVKLFGHFEDNNYCYFIMEYISKGNLYGLIPKEKKKRLTPQAVASIMKDVISAVYFLHNMKPIIIHRDIKPENVLINEDLIAKLTDFGWSNYMSDEETRKTMCGTPIYLAPEIIKEEGHDERVDVWCIGVLLFELSTGNIPFEGTDIDSLKNNILHLKIVWPKDIKPEVKGLISRILKLNPNDRISLEEMLKHPFFTKYYPDAHKNLIKPKQNVIYKPFIVSKDDPKTWEPYESIPENEEINKDDFSIEKYNELKKKFEELDSDYKNYNKDLAQLDDIKNQIKEKDERIKEITEKMKESGEDFEEKDLKTKCKNLEDEHKELKLQIKDCEEKIKQKQGQEIDNKLNDFRQSITADAQENVSVISAIENMKNQLDKDTRTKLNNLIKEKEKEIKKFKEEEKARREKEKKKFVALINKYDKTLSWIEKTNKELKAKIKELEKKGQ